MIIDVAPSTPVCCLRNFCGHQILGFCKKSALIVLYICEFAFIVLSLLPKKDTTYVIVAHSFLVACKEY